MAEMLDDGERRLPGRRSSSPPELVDRSSLAGLIGLGLLVYCLIVLLFTCTEAILGRFGCPTVARTLIGADGRSSSVAVSGFLDFLYFNFVTVMTIGYGDLTPIGCGRWLACVEAISGLIVFGAILSAAVLKLMLPPRSTVIFSRYCYFTADDARFVVVFVNTARSRLVNVAMCSVLKMGRANWIVRPSFRTPYIGSSAWTFSVNSLEEHLSPEEIRRNDLRRLTLHADDGLKFGMDGSIGVASFSASVKYDFTECYVVRSKDDLPTEALEEPRFGDPALESAFHFVPPEPITFAQWAARRGAQVEF
jgi:hypothetical protein